MRLIEWWVFARGLPGLRLDDVPGREAPGLHGKI